MKAISFYTDFYEKPAKQLMEDLDAIGMEHDIRNVPDKGSWRKNVLYKPIFIWEMLQGLPEDAKVVFLDADTRVRGSFEYPGGEIAYAYSHYSRDRKREPLCGALFLTNNWKVRAFIKRWTDAVRGSDPTLRRPEQQILRELLPDCGLDTKVLRDECGLFSLEDGHFEEGSGVIVHGRWSDEAGTPPESDGTKAETEWDRDEDRRMRADVDMARKLLVRRKRKQTTKHFWNKFRIPSDVRAALSLTFDDGRVSQFDHARPILDEFGVKGTFYVCPGLVKKQRWMWPRPKDRKIELASWPEIVYASDIGHEIGNHSWSHPNFAKMMDNIDNPDRLAEMRQEITGASSALAHRTGKAHFSFAWPYHRQDGRCIEEIHRCHTGIRQLQPRGCYHVSGSLKDQRRKIREFVDMLIAEKLWGQAAIHDVEAGEMPVPADVLRWHIEDVLSRPEIKFVRVSDMYEETMRPLDCDLRRTPREERLGIKAQKPVKKRGVKKQTRQREMRAARRVTERRRRRRKIGPQ